MKTKKRKYLTVALDRLALDAHANTHTLSLSLFLSHTHKHSHTDSHTNTHSLSHVQGYLAVALDRGPLNGTPPTTTIWPKTQAYCRVLRGG